MNEADTTGKDEVGILRRKLARLQWWVFCIWPLVFSSAIVMLLFGVEKRESTSDSKGAITVKYSIDEETLLRLLGSVLVLALFVGTTLFVARVWHDFKMRHYRFSLNPGSKPSRIAHSRS